jgi:hypothetical protein
MLSLAGGTFQAQSVEDSDPFSIDSDNARLAQFTQRGGDGLAINVQLLGDFFVREVFDTFPLDRSRSRLAMRGIRWRNDVASRSSSTRTKRSLTRSSKRRVMIGYCSSSLSS